MLRSSASSSSVLKTISISPIMLFNVTQCMGANLQYQHLPRVATPTKRAPDQCTGNLLPWVAGHLLPAPPMDRCSQNHYLSFPRRRLDVILKAADDILKAADESVSVRLQALISHPVRMQSMLKTTLPHQ